MGESVMFWASEVPPEKGEKIALKMTEDIRRIRTT